MRYTPGTSTDPRRLTRMHWELEYFHIPRDGSEGEWVPIVGIEGAPAKYITSSEAFDAAQVFARTVPGYRHGIRLVTVSRVAAVDQVRP